MPHHYTNSFSAIRGKIEKAIDEGLTFIEEEDEQDNKEEVKLEDYVLSPIE